MHMQPARPHVHLLVERSIASPMRIVCGPQSVREALRAYGARLGRVLVESPSSPKLALLARFAEERGAAVERCPRSELDRLSRGVRHQGILAFAPELTVSLLDRSSLGPCPLVAALDELEDPQNFGAIVRSAVAFGADAIMWPEHHSAPLSTAMFRASAGAVEHARLVRVPSLPRALEELSTDGLSVVGLDANAVDSLDRLELTGPLVVVVGAEGKGLRKPVKQACSRLAKLPLTGPVASLNASVALAIALYEARRQRGFDGGDRNDSPLVP